MTHSYFVSRIIECVLPKIWTLISEDMIDGEDQSPNDEEVKVFYITSHTHIN